MRMKWVGQLSIPSKMCVAYMTVQPDSENDNARTLLHTFLGFTLEEFEQVHARQHVQIHSDLIEQEQRERIHQSQQDLHTTRLTIRDLGG